MKQVGIDEGLSFGSELDIKLIDFIGYYFNALIEMHDRMSSTDDINLVEKYFIQYVDLIHSSELNQLKLGYNEEEIIKLLEIIESNIRESRLDYKDYFTKVTELAYDLRNLLGGSKWIKKIEYIEWAKI